MTITTDVSSPETFLMHPAVGSIASEPTITLYDPELHPDNVLLPQLVSLLSTVIHAGAIMQFIPPLDSARLHQYWKNSLQDKKRKVILSFAPADGEELKLIGTVVLYDIASDTGPFRAKVEKLMVSPEWRGHGVARRLMERLEMEGLRKGLTYLTLGTETGSPAETMYLRLGYTAEGVLPEYCVSPVDGSLRGNTHFYKRLNKTTLVSEADLRELHHDASEHVVFPKV